MIPLPSNGFNQSRVDRLCAAMLTAEDFAPFGDVIQEPAVDPDDPKPNRRFDDLITIDAGPEGTPMVSLLRMLVPAQAPVQLTKLERHPLGSQAFIPCSPARFLVAVAPGNDVPELDGLKVFVTDGRQGVNYRRGVWHAPMAILSPGTLAVVDRKGSGPNCDIFTLPCPLIIEIV